MRLEKRLDRCKKYSNLVRGINFCLVLKLESLKKLYISQRFFEFPNSIQLNST